MATKKIDEVKGADICHLDVLNGLCQELEEYSKGFSLSKMSTESFTSINHVLKKGTDIAKKLRERDALGDTDIKLSIKVNILDKDRQHTDMADCNFADEKKSPLYDELPNFLADESNQEVVTSSPKLLQEPFQSVSLSTSRDDIHGEEMPLSWDPFHSSSAASFPGISGTRKDTVNSHKSMLKSASMQSMRHYSFKEKQKPNSVETDLSLDPDIQWRDENGFSSSDCANWIVTPLYHPFWFECMTLLKTRRGKPKSVTFEEKPSRYSNGSSLSTQSFPVNIIPDKVSDNKAQLKSNSMQEIFRYFCSLNGTLPPKDYSGHALKKFLIEMKSKNFDDIKLAKYRAAAKLLFVQKATHLHLVDIYNIIEAFRENGLNTLDHSAELDEARLECIVASIYYALYKRLPSTKDIDVERCIVILTQWLMHAYDSGNNGRIRVSSVKTALSALCDGRLVDKFRYVFTQISETNGILVASKLDNYLRELLLLPCAVGEEANFGYTEDILDSFFKPDGPLERTHTKLDDFLDVFLNEASSNVLLWLQMFNKLIQTSTVEHFTQCRGCGKKDFFGLRYKCKQCLNFHLCQECFWRERVAGSHRLEHDVREYTSWSKSERGNTVRKKFLCSPSKSTQQKLPDYPREPEPNKTLDMSNIVPPLPSEPSTPNTTLLRKPRQMSASPSQHSTLSRVSSKLSHDSVSRQDDEHRLITLYAQRLAEHGLNRHTRTRKLSENTYSQPSAEQKEILDSLEEKNRSLLQEIRQLKMKHDEAMKNEQQMGSDPNLLTELRVLRQHKDELELRMSALQETRRELMVQLEGLMKLLKNTEGSNSSTES